MRTEKEQQSGEAQKESSPPPTILRAATMNARQRPTFTSQIRLFIICPRLSHHSAS